MIELLEFLRARYDEDVLVIGHYERYMSERGAAAGSFVLVIPPGWQPGEPFDPDRQRDEIDAKRRILDEILRYEAEIDGEWGDGHTAEEIAAGECPERHPDNIPAFRALALPHAGHPDYRSEWAVTK